MVFNLFFFFLLNYKVSLKSIQMRAGKNNKVRICNHNVKRGISLSAVKINQAWSNEDSQCVVIGILDILVIFLTDALRLGHQGSYCASVYQHQVSCQCSRVRALSLPILLNQQQRGKNIDSSS